jgi:histidinol phosphatase-like PHP family hydrolase
MAVPNDLNALVADRLLDMAAAQTSQQRRWGYRRAAAAVRLLDQPLDRLRTPDGGLAKIRHVGPASTRIILELIDTGRSPTIERAIAESGRADAPDEPRPHFLSRAQVVATLKNRRLHGPEAAAYRGDLQMHSVWSDGVDTLEDLADGCRARGYQYCAVTDHSHGLPIAGGVSMADIARQHREINRVNAAHAGAFRMLKGIEANILADGSLDLTGDERAVFELIVAAPHSRLRRAEDQTARMLAAVGQPRVHILGHPRGRMGRSRPGIVADWPRVFADAARREVAIEIDGDPARQDVDFELAAAALDAGCLFALDSDAHAVSQLSYAETAIAHARLAGIPPDRIVNCWPLERLLQWLAAGVVHRRLPIAD